MNVNKIEIESIYCRYNYKANSLKNRFEINNKTPVSFSDMTKI